MQWRNTDRGYGWIGIGLHWVMALLLIGLFALGKYMVALDYYHPWYLRAPDLHRGLGVVVALLWALRLGWRSINPRPAILGRPWERRLALGVHWTFYLLIPALAMSGYLISTAKGQGLDVFGWLRIPAVLHGLPDQEDIAGVVHAWLADGLMTLAGLHALAALKHHFLDGDSTLRRMIRPFSSPSE